jgi:WD40 repeat protein
MFATVSMAAACRPPASASCSRPAATSGRCRSSTAGRATSRRPAASAERNPEWSPDGRWIAYLSDETGEYELYITQSDGKGETKQLTDNGERYRYILSWSPDSEHLLFADASGATYLYTLETEKITHIDTDPWANIPGTSWSHDSCWIAYTRSGDNQFASLWLYKVKTGEKFQVTSGMFADSQPAFDREGKFFYFASHRSWNSPTYEDLGNTFVYRDTDIVCVVPLRKDVEWPWTPELQEESFKTDDDKDNGKDKKKDKGKDKDEKKDDEKSDDDDQDDNGNGKDQAIDEGVSGVYSGTLTGGADLPPDGLPFALTLRIANSGEVSGTMSAGPNFGTISDGTYTKDSGEIRFTIVVSDGDAAGSYTVAAVIAEGSIVGTVSGTEFFASFSADRTGPLEEDESEDGAESADEEEAEEEDAEPLEIDIEGFEQRAIQLPVGSGAFYNLAVSADNKLFYIRRGAGIRMFDIRDDKRNEKSVMDGAGFFQMTPDGKKLMVRRGNSFAIVRAAPGQKFSNPVKLNGMDKVVNPREEWRQIFMDAWRVERDFFYVANMHGVDWEAMRDHYIAMLDDCVSRDDVAFVIRELIAELNIGHAYYYGSHTGPEPRVLTGMLGVDFDLVDGAYQITRIIKGGPWDVDARGPLSQPGVKVQEGDFLLAVNGVPVDTSKDPWAAFVGIRPGQITTLTVSDKPVLEPPTTAADDDQDKADDADEADDDAADDDENGDDEDGDDEDDLIVEPETRFTGQRDVNVKLMPGESGLRFRDWVERNRKYVDDRTDGKVGYIYVPDTGINGQNELFRQFYGQRRKLALIIDERWNGGGQIPDRFIELLNRPLRCFWARRYGESDYTADVTHHGPKCMLINGAAGSGGDAFPYFFRQSGLGKLIGTRTWGGLVGISGNPRFVDGASVTVPRFGFYELDGTWGIEGHGVDPDIEVIANPALMVNGGDPQLDAAIDLMLEEIQQGHFEPVPVPPLPDRSGFGIPDDER